jgi:hypothetical protein
MLTRITGGPPNHFPRDQGFVSTLGGNRSSISCGFGAVPDSAQDVAILVETAYWYYGIAWRARMLLSNVVRTFNDPPPLLGFCFAGIELLVHQLPRLYPEQPPCYNFEVPKIIVQWLLYKYIGGEFTPLSKPFKTKEQAEKARLKYPERERRTIGLGIVRLSEGD